MDCRPGARCEGRGNPRGGAPVREATSALVDHRSTTDTRG
jgi:hypothetical protein